MRCLYRSLSSGSVRQGVVPWKNTKSWHHGLHDRLFMITDCVPMRVRGTSASTGTAAFWTGSKPERKHKTPITFFGGFTCNIYSFDESGLRIYLSRQ